MFPRSYLAKKKRKVHRKNSSLVFKYEQRLFSYATSETLSDFLARKEILLSSPAKCIVSNMGPGMFRECLRNVSGCAGCVRLFSETPPGMSP